MPTMGEVLRDARLRLGMSVDQASEDTKVRKKYLIALEEDDHAELPPPIYAKGFLHIYAEYLGVDPVFASKLYQPPALMASTPAIRPAASGLRMGTAISAQTVLAVLSVALVVAAIFYLYSQYLTFASTPIITAVESPTQLPAASPSAVPAVVVPVATPAPVPTATPVRPTAVPTPVFGVEVTVRITERCWFEVRVDGATSPVYQGVLEAGATMTWKARDRIDVRVGNAGGVEATVNGMNQGKLGASGEVKNVTWGRQ
jgi:transcriptional regulator with XRE-family HTH domain